jgi:hypothetical protein
MSKVNWTGETVDYGALGRNGIMKSAGVNVYPVYDNCVRIAPITSKGVEGRCFIHIPNADREAVARMIYPEGFK